MSPPCRRGVVILELFSGYASHGQTIQNILTQRCYWARDAKTDKPLLIPDVQLLTLDRDFTPPEAAKSPTHFQVDAQAFTAANIKLLLDLFEVKDFIILASPPCQAYSRMNSDMAKKLKKQKDAAQAKELLQQSDKLVTVVKTIHETIYATGRRVVTILENPATGRLKQRTVIKWINKFYFDIDYCQYGGQVKKETRFWTTINLTEYGFQPKVCPGWPGCQAMLPPAENPKRAARHVEYETGPMKCSHKRSRIPELLSNNIGSALLTYLETNCLRYEPNYVRARPVEPLHPPSVKNK
jgi:hypothetical protein